jgi:hypothetical protein
VTLPASIKIGTHNWSVTEIKRKNQSDNEHYGFTNDRDASITIDSEMPNSVKRVTLLHEILHAIRFTFGGSYSPSKGTTYEEWEHYFIGLYEEPMTMVLRENPELVKYLLADD